jgi:hypothetical protein
MTYICFRCYLWLWDLGSTPLEGRDVTMKSSVQRGPNDGRVSIVRVQPLYLAIDYHPEQSSVVPQYFRSASSVTKVDKAYIQCP